MKNGVKGGLNFGWGWVGSSLVYLFGVQLSWALVFRVAGFRSEDVRARDSLEEMFYGKVIEFVVTSFQL